MKKLSVLIQILCALFSISLLTVCSKQQESSTKSKVAQLPKVTVTQPKIRKVERVITAIGTLEPDDNVLVSAKVAGVVQEIKFEEGEVIKQGDVLIKLDPTDFQLNLDNSKALLERARANLVLAKANYERKKSLYEKNFIPKQEFQEFKTSLSRAKADFDSAKATYKIAKKFLEDSVIRAPIDTENKNYYWEVQRKLVSIGEYVNPGKPVVELVNREILRVRFTVPEREASYLNIGKSIQFSVPALPGKVFEAKIFYLSPQISESARAVVVKAKFNNQERILRPGYSANVRMIAETREKSLIIPRRALRFDIDKSFVWVVVDKILHRKNVSVGVEEEDYVEIISGINQNDKVVVRSGSSMKEGTKVEIVEGSN